MAHAHDEATPLIVGQIHERIPDAEWELFEESSHMPHVEEPDAFLERIEAFLRGVTRCVEARAQARPAPPS
jgi:L-proline amide hydrolase